MAAIPYPDFLPEPDEGSFRFGLATNTLFFGGQNIATSERTEDLGGHKWSFEAAYSHLDFVEGRRLASWLVRVLGPVGRFYMGDRGYLIEGPRGSAGGAPLVQGAGQTGNSLALDGLPASETDWLMEGDYFSLDIGGIRFMHMCINDVDTNASGEATVSFNPPLVRSPADNTALTITGADCTMRLLNDEQLNWAYMTLNGEQSASFRIQAVQSYI